MKLAEHDIIQKYGKNCPSCNRNNFLPYAYEWTCLSCNYVIRKQTNNLTKNQRKRQTFASRLEYSEKNILAICFDVMQIYSGDDYNKMFDVLSCLKNKNLYIKKELIEIY